jgi:hypothetical protein
MNTYNVVIRVNAKNRAEAVINATRVLEAGGLPDVECTSKARTVAKKAAAPTSGPKPQRGGARTPLTAMEIGAIIDLHKRGFTNERIAKETGRTVGSVYSLVYAYSCSEASFDKLNHGKAVKDTLRQLRRAKA